MPLNTESLENSFALIRAHESEFSAGFYSNLFLDYPQVKPLFKTTDMDEQAKKLFSSLVLVVNNLTKPDTLTNALKGLGTKHIKYGVLPEHYPMVGATLLKTMATTLKDDWTPNVEKAWTEAYTVIAEVMLEGAGHSEEIIALDKTPAATPA